jgi:hypothetical protein
LSKGELMFSRRICDWGVLLEPARRLGDGVVCDE